MAGITKEEGKLSKDYLRNLISPSSAMSGVPDAFYLPTCKFTQRIVLEVGSAIGDYTFKVNPTINGTVEYSTPTVASAIENVLTHLNFSRLTPLRYLYEPYSVKDQDLAVNGFVASVFDMVLGVEVDLPMFPPLNVTNGGSDLQLPFRYHDPLQGYNPFLSSGTVYMTFSYQFKLISNQASPFDVGKVRLTNDDTFTTVDLPLTVSEAVVAGLYVTITSRTQVAITQEGFYHATWFTNSTIVNSFEPIELTLSVSQTYNNPTGGNNILMLSKDVPDLGTIIRDFRKVRITGQSVLLSYTGDMLQNGMLSAGCIQDGTSYLDANAALCTTDHVGLNNMPRSYTGPAQEGCYMIYRPQTIEMATRWSTPHATWYPDLPYNLIKFHCPSAAMTFRLEIIVNIEAQTIVPLYNMSVTPGGYSNLMATFSALQHFPYVCENPFHLDAIFDALKGVANAAPDIIHGVSRVVNKVPILQETGLSKALDVASALAKNLPKFKTGDSGYNAQRKLGQLAHIGEDGYNLKDALDFKLYAKPKSGVQYIPRGPKVVYKIDNKKSR